MVKTRKFGKNTYKMRGWSDTKKHADERAKNLRRVEGVSVRITRTSHPVGYAYWTYSKTSK